MKSSKQKSSASQLVWVLLCGIAAILIAYFAEFHLIKEEAPAPKEPAARILINELMSRNDTALLDDTGAYSDWLEIINEESSPVDLTGWQLVTLDDPLIPFTFPDVTLYPGECLLVYASGQDRRDAFHAPFKLSASGETVVLTDPYGVQADSVQLPALSADEVWTRSADNGEWSVSPIMTPALPNDPENAAERALMEDDIVLSEIIASNSSLTASGHDLIEISNTGSQPLSLAGYSLTDDPGQPGKYVLGDVSIEAGGYLLIEADGQNVPFRLSAAGEEVLLYNPAGHPVSSAAWTDMKADQSFSCVDGQWAFSVPTPGYANTPASAALLDSQLTAANTTGLFISEILASSSESGEYDWVELYNSTSAPIDLSGFGLSDNSGHPRKWQFPDGVLLAPQNYLVVLLSGKDTLDSDGSYHTNFSLSCTSTETVTLCTPDGVIFDRACAAEMYGDVAYGRMPGQNGYFYLSASTPGAPNSVQGFRTRAEKPVFSVDGGIYENGETLTLSMSSQEGMTIRYTLDASTPTESSPVYDGPITITDTTVVRAAVSGPDAMSSYIETQTYLFGVDHTVRVISVVSDPEGLFSEKTGIMAMGPNALETDPYTGANFWNNWEREANVEIFETDGTTLLDQACGLSLHGTNSRKRPQKAFCLTARTSYDEDNRFRADLFSERDYSEYQSFILRSGGQDDEMTRIHDSVITQLAADMDMLYQESELCVVYLNGEYWGQYDMREKINRFSIAQFENWDADDSISIVKGSYNILRGSNKHYEALLEWLKAHPEATDEDIAYVETQVDLDNYLDYICLMVYSGNQDIGMRRYRNTDADGLWRWVIFDMDYAFYNDTDSMRRWMDPAGAGTNNRTDNSLFVYVMKNASVKDRFLTRFGQLVTGPWAAEKVVQMIQDQYEAMLPEMEAHYQKWPGSRMERWQQYIQEMLDYAATREEKIIGYTQQHFSLTDAEMQKYFGGN